MSTQAAQLHGYYRWHAHIYDATRWAFLFGRAGLIRLVAQTLQPRRILEVGCGTGKNLAVLARVFPDAEILGLDLSAEMLAKAERKIAPFGPRVSLRQAVYAAPISEGRPFDLIVFSYCLTMINPGYEDVVRVAVDDLHPVGRLAVVDFCDSPHSWFRRWMGANHVRMEGQVLQAIAAAGLHQQVCSVHPAYAGLWRWFTCIAAR